MKPHLILINASTNKADLIFYMSGNSGMILPPKTDTFEFEDVILRMFNKQSLTEVK